MATVTVVSARTLARRRLPSHSRAAASTVSSTYHRCSAAAHGGGGAAAHTGARLSDFAGRRSCQILPLPTSRDRFKSQSNLAWNSIELVGNFAFNYSNTPMI